MKIPDCRWAIAACLACAAPLRVDPLNAVYTVEGEQVALVNGRSEKQAAPGSAMKTVFSVVGRVVGGDLNSDGKADAALILSASRGGSGTYFYVAAAVNINGEARGTNAILLGDRVAPGPVEIKNGKIAVRYAGHKPTEPFTAKPSVQMTKILALNGLTIEESIR